MASLTQASIIARKTIRYSIYSIILLIVGRVVINAGFKIFRVIFPEPPPPPEVCFGKLTTLPFPEGAPGFENLTFTLETATGDLPAFPEQLSVHFMPKAPASLQNLELAKQKALSLGFQPGGRELVETVFLFQHSTAPSSLTMNIVSGIFSISYDLRANPRAIDNLPPAPEAASVKVRSYLSQAGLFKEDLSGPATYNFIKIVEGRFEERVSLSESDLTKVNLFRKNFNDISPVTPNPKQSNVWFMLSGSRDKENQIIAAEYQYYPIDEERGCTYPLITAKQAWESLTSGSGFIASTDNNQTQITIRRVYLAYYDAGQYTEFYQPVVVFEGDNNFVAYIPAVTGDFYGE